VKTASMMAPGPAGAPQLQPPPRRKHQVKWQAPPPLFAPCPPAPGLAAWQEAMASRALEGLREGWYTCRPGRGGQGQQQGQGQQAEQQDGKEAATAAAGDGAAGCSTLAPSASNPKQLPEAGTGQGRSREQAGAGAGGAVARGAAPGLASGGTTGGGGASQLYPSVRGPCCPHRLGALAAQQVDEMYIEVGCWAAQSLDTRLP
jgi:hypothetical protein